MLLFAVGTFWFWVLIAAELVLLTAFVEYENGVGATFSLLIFGALIQLCSDVNLLAYLKEHPFGILTLAFLFTIMGCIYSCFRWVLWVRDRKKDYEETKLTWLAEKKITNGTIPDALKADWKTYLEKNAQYHRDYRGSYKISATPPQVREHKDRVIRWLAFWPISLLWWFAHDAVTRLFNEIYELIRVQYQKIADRIFASVKNDLPSENE
jgi:hypothetical protein